VFRQSRKREALNQLLAPEDVDKPGVSESTSHRGREKAGHLLPLQITGRFYTSIAPLEREYTLSHDTSALDSNSCDVVAFWILGYS